MENVGGIQGVNMRDLCTRVPVCVCACVCVCVCVCRLVVRHLWQCQCVTAGPLAREQRLERLPSRVAFVW